MQFYERLYALRKASGMTQAELAEKMNVSRQAISRWEMGTAKPDSDNLITLSRLYGVSTDYLLLGEPDTVPSPEQSAKPKKKQSNVWSGLMLMFFMALFAIIAVLNQDPLSAIVTAGIIVAVVWGIKIVIVAALRD